MWSSLGLDNFFLILKIVKLLHESFFFLTKSWICFYRKNTIKCEIEFLDSGETSRFQDKPLRQDPTILDIWIPDKFFKNALRAREAIFNMHSSYWLKTEDAHRLTWEAEQNWTETLSPWESESWVWGWILIGVQSKCWSRCSYSHPHV